MDPGHLMYRFDGVCRGKGDGGGLQHADVVGVVAHAVEVLRLDVQHVRQMAHHVALAGALGRQLQQKGAAGDDLILRGPGLGADIAVQRVQLLRHDLEQGLADRGRRLVDGVQHGGGLVGQVQMGQRQLIGVQGEDGVVVVIQLHCRLRPGVQHLHDMGPYRVR